jgi:hypothetical protein
MAARYNRALVAHRIGKVMSVITTFLLTIIVCLFFAIIRGCGTTQKEEKVGEWIARKAVERRTVMAQSPAYIVTERQIGEEFNLLTGNPAVAEKKYANKVIVVKGKVWLNYLDVTKRIELNGEGKGVGLTCWFSDKGARVLPNLREGEKVAIKGYCTGMAISIHLEDCELIPLEQTTTQK